MTTQKLYKGDSMGRIFKFYNEDDEYIDPATITIEIIDPNGTTKATKTKTDLTRVDKGQYKLVYSIPSDAETGLWTIKATAVSTEGVQNTEKFVFEVVE